VASTRVTNSTAPRKGAADESWRQWLARAGITMALAAGLGLAALAPVAAPAVVGLAHVGHAAPIAAHARQFDPSCPGGLANC